MLVAAASKTYRVWELADSHRRVWYPNSPSVRFQSHGRAGFSGVTFVGRS